MEQQCAANSRWEQPPLSGGAVAGIADPYCSLFALRSRRKECSEFKTVVRIFKILLGVFNYELYGRTAIRTRRRPLC